MCGATDAQNQLQDQQKQFYQNLQTQDAQVFGENQNILNQIQSVYSPILQKGPNQYGFSQDEENTLETTANEGVAQNYRAASKALRENQAAAGGGDDYLPTGTQQQQQASLAQSAADQLSKEQLGIKQAGYEQGYKEFTDAAGTMLSGAGLLNPTAYAGEATSAGSAEGTTANQIAQENESWMTPLMGAIGAVGGAAMGAYGQKHF